MGWTVSLGNYVRMEVINRHFRNYVRMEVINLHFIVVRGWEDGGTSFLEECRDTPNFRVWYGTLFYRIEGNMFGWI